MNEGEREPGTSRARPIATVLDLLRARFDHEKFDAVVISLESVAVDLGYGDVRPLPGSIAWVERMREEGKHVLLLAAGERGNAALEMAGLGDAFDQVVSGPRTAGALADALQPLELDPARTVFVDVAPAGIEAAAAAGYGFLIAVARGEGSPEALRNAGAAIIVADLLELLGPING